MRCTRLILLSFAIAMALPAQGRDGRRRARTAPELENITFAEKEFDSEAIGREMPYGIYLPNDYDESQDVSYPLVIWLHGMWEDHRRFHYRGGAPVLDKAIGDGLLPPCIFVCANGGRTSMYINAGKGKNYQDLVQKDLLAHLTKNYRVIGKRDSRALMGISMGGMAAMRIGFTDPDLFGTIAVHSSAVFPPDPEKLPPQLVRFSARFGLDEVFGNPIDAELWRKTNPLGIAADLDPESLHGLRLFFDAGTDDRYSFGAANKALHELLEKRAIAHTWNLVEGGGHAWGSGFKDASLLASLKFVGEGFEAAGQSDGKGESAPPAKSGR